MCVCTRSLGFCLCLSAYLAMYMLLLLCIYPAAGICVACIESDALHKNPTLSEQTEKTGRSQNVTKCYVCWPVFARSTRAHARLMRSRAHANAIGHNNMGLNGHQCCHAASTFGTRIYSSVSSSCDDGVFIASSIKGHIITTTHLLYAINKITTKHTHTQMH